LFSELERGKGKRKAKAKTKQGQKQRQKRNAGVLPHSTLLRVRMTGAATDDCRRRQISMIAAAGGTKQKDPVRPCSESAKTGRGMGREADFSAALLAKDASSFGRNDNSFDWEARG
jgi:hypothetical protein